MNTSNQNETSPKPDFDFIMKQPGHEPTHGKKDKRLIIIAVLLGVLIITVIAGALLSSRSNVKEEPAQVQTISGLKAEEAITKFLQYMSQGDYMGAASLLAPDSSLDEAKLKEENATLLSKLNLESCQLQPDTSPNSPGLPVYTCKAKNQDISVSFAFQVVDIDGVAKIFNYYIYTDTPS